MKLVGDWAMALWDPDLVGILLARDFAGVRPLFYATTPYGSLWSSELASLLALLPTGHTVNDAWIAGFLGLGPNPAQTPYKDIHAVPPGYFVTLSKSGLRTERYWKWDRTRTVRYRSDVQYEEHFRSLLREAVSRRLRCNGAVSAQLSGGLDSSSIVLMADDILKREGAGAPQLVTISHVYDESPESDERLFINAVESQLGRHGYHFNETSTPLFESLLYHGTCSPVPTLADCYASREKRISSTMLAANVRIQLSGEGGDELLGNTMGSAADLADLLYTCKLGPFLRRAGWWNSGSRMPYAALIASAVKALYQTRESAFRDLLRQLYAVAPSPFADQIRQEVLAARSDYIDDFRLPSQRGRASGLLSVVNRVARAPHRAFGGIEIRYPYLHRPLVEFLLAIPLEQLTRPGEPRSLMRRALKGLLPAVVAKRRSKNSPSPALHRAIARERRTIAALFNRDAAIYQRGYADRALVLSALQRASHGLFPASALAPLICVEQWLKHNEAVGLISQLPSAPAQVENLERQRSHYL